MDVFINNLGLFKPAEACLSAVPLRIPVKNIRPPPSNSTMSDHDDMMMDLFRSEIESHTESLTAALLSLEQDTSATNLIDGMMRAAHSVKGAARIVQIEPAVQLAHVMEDCFVAAQRGEIVLRPAGIDVLLRGVDLLCQISEESRKDKPNWGALQPTISQLVQLLQQVHAGREPIAGESTVAPVVASTTDSLAQSQSGITTPIASEVGSQPTIHHVTGQPASSSTGSSTSTTIYFPEYLNASGAEKVRQEFVSLVQQAHIKRIDLDLSATQDLDAIGVAFLDALATHVTANPSVAVSITSTSPTLARVIRCLNAKCLLLARPNDCD
jgi:chemotaxis protein histidine kinase CheA